MKTAKKILISLLLTAFAATLFSFDLPKGWFKAGSKPKSYVMDIDKGAGQDGKDVFTIKSIKKKIKGFGNIMQNSLPEKYLSKKVRMSCFVKSKDVADWAGMWLRIDQTGSDRMLGFDNMQNRPIKGTTEWTKYEIVLYVPSKATNLAYGVMLIGTGQIWFDNITFEIVDNSVETTGE